MVTHKFIQQNDLGPDVENSDYLRRIKKALLRKSIEYEAKTDTTNDIPEIETLRFASRYPESVVKNIGWLFRVALPKANMFEINEDTGELDSKHKVKQALVYHLNCYVTDPNMEGERKIVGFNRTEGVYRDPIVQYRHDRDGRRTGFSTIGTRNIFYIEYTPENVDKILKEMSNYPNTMGVCIASEEGSSPWVKNPYKIHNFDEFRNIDDIYGLIEASVGTATVQGSKAGTFLRAEYGGYDDYREWLANKPKRKYIPPPDSPEAESRKSYSKKE